jgi:trehalose 6-phosphate synthase
VSHAIRRGLEMSRGEQHQRMERMRRQVKEHNVYRWASNILSDLCAVRLEEEWIESAQNQSNRRLA